MTPRPTGRRERRAADDVLVLTRELPAPIDDVWASVTAPDRLGRWIGTWTGDPAEGFVTFTMTAEGEDVPPARCDVRVCDAPRHLAVQLVDEAGAWLLALDLAEHDGTTTLTFAQVIDDPDALESTGPGWEYYLDRLAAVVTGEDPAAVDFDHYFPAQSEHHRALGAATS